MTAEDSGSVVEMAMTDCHAGRLFQNHRGSVPEQVPSHEEHGMSPEHLAAAPDDEGNVFDDDDQDTSEVGGQAEDAPEVGEHPVETPAALEVAEHPPGETSGRRARGRLHSHPNSAGA